MNKKNKILLKIACIYLIAISIISIFSINSYATNIDIKGIFDSTEILTDKKPEFRIPKIKKPLNGISDDSDLIPKTNEQNKGQVKKPNLNNINKNSEYGTRAREVEATLIPEVSKNNILSLGNKTNGKFKKYLEKYNGKRAYAIIAFILESLAIFAIPLTIIFLVLSIVYDTIIGLKTRELYNKGQAIRTTILIFFGITQVMPLIFALLTKGWGM